MNYLKKLLLITFVIFAGIESSDAGTQKRLKLKIQRTNKKIAQEVGQIFTTDNKEQIAKEVNDVQLLAKNPEQKQEVAKALQKEIIKQTKEIKQELSKADQGAPEYITYMQALDIIKSKKELSDIKSSSWTNSYIIKPLTKTYRLFLRVWDQKKYAELLEQERKLLERALSVQAHNNIMLLYVALDLATKQQDLNIEHMFKKENFYKTMIHAFEGGALFASDIQLSNKVKDLITELNMLITQNFEKISTNKAVVQSIWQMNEILWETQHPREGYRIKHGLTPEKDINYDWFAIKDLCEKAAKTNGQILVDSKESYTQYLQKWILQPKNVAKVGFAIAAIGGLYIYGPAVPAWLKEYSTSSIGSIKGALSKGYNATISSVKNLWNKISGNKTQELPDFKEARIDGQLDNEIYLSNAFSHDQSAQDIENSVYESSWQYYADDLETKREKKAREKQFYEELKKDNEERKRQIEESDAIATLFDIQKIQTEDAFKENEKARGLQKQGQMLNDFDDEIKSDELAQALAQRNWDADKEKALQAEAIEKAKTEPESEYETAGKIRFNPTSGSYNPTSGSYNKENLEINQMMEKLTEQIQSVEKEKKTLNQATTNQDKQTSINNIEKLNQDILFNIEKLESTGKFNNVIDKGILESIKKQAKTTNQPYSSNDSDKNISESEYQTAGKIRGNPRNGERLMPIETVESSIENNNEFEKLSLEDELEKRGQLLEKLQNQLEERGQTLEKLQNQLEERGQTLEKLQNPLEGRDLIERHGTQTEPDLKDETAGKIRVNPTSGKRFIPGDPKKSLEEEFEEELEKRNQEEFQKRNQEELEKELEKRHQEELELEKRKRSQKELEKIFKEKLNNQPLTTH